MYSSSAPAPPTAAGPSPRAAGMAPPAAAGGDSPHNNPQGYSPYVNPMEIEGSRRARRRPGRGPPPPKTTLAAALMLVGGIVSVLYVRVEDRGWVMLLTDFVGTCEANSHI